MKPVWCPSTGASSMATDRKGAYNPMWMDWRVLIGMPYDMLIPGYGGRTVNVLRLYSARSSHDFDMQIFNDGDYFKAVEQKIASETISKVLYPSDAIVAGRELRLVQEYFLVACAMRDIVRRFEQDHDTFREFASKVAIQLNDTHPALTVAELMRVLVDEKDLEWEDAWKITRATLGYTNHTLAPEALEKWPVPLLEAVSAEAFADYSRNQSPFSGAGCGGLYPATLMRSGACPSSRSQRPNRCSWRISRWREAIRSTGSQRFTANWSGLRSRPISFGCIRNDSITRPTASRRGAGC